MPPLAWDDTLAATAQEWANRIAASGAVPPPHRAAGENLFWGTAGQWQPKDVLEIWEGESKNYDRATNTCAPGKNCVHFTQVVWTTTTRLGCGIAKGMSKGEATDFIVCNYSPPGNEDSPPGNEVGQSPFPKSPTPPLTATLTPTGTPPPATTPIPVARVITPAATPTPAAAPNTNTECCQNLRKDVQQLTARVEQLRKQISEAAKLTAPTPTKTPVATPTPVARLIPPAPTPTPRPVARLIDTDIERTPPRVIIPDYDPTAKCPQYGIEFVQIPAGSFMMGATGNAKPHSNELPVHEVTISQPFCLGRYEVTQGQWQAVMGGNPSSFKDCGGKCPVEQVSWYDTQNFIKKLNEGNDGFRYRLPTESEWEYACRAGTTTDHAGPLFDMAWFSENSERTVHAVGGKQPNGWGLYDMHGNVDEWCQDWYQASYDGAPTDGSAWLYVSPDGSQKYRVLRGGSWREDGIDLLSASRNRKPPDYRLDDVGFRVVAVRAR